MCVHGLHPRDSGASATPSVSSTNSHLSPSKAGTGRGGVGPTSPSQRKKERARPPYDPILGRNIFEWSWCCFPPTATERGGPRGSTIDPFSCPPLVKGIGSAMKLASAPSSSSSSRSLTTSPHSYLRFTRSSTPPSLLLPEMTSEDSSLSEEGCYLGLCRVLMNSIHTIPPEAGELNSTSIFEAMRTGCDTVYSEKRSVSLLLGPSYFP
jgi:hypothetical protein